MCAKVSGDCAHNNQEVSGDLHLGVCLSRCLFVCLCVPVSVAASNTITVL